VLRLHVIITALLVLSPPVCGAEAKAREKWTGKVVGVSDGDTITVLRDKSPIKIRLHGVDAPEKAQPFGEKAKQFTSGLVFGKQVEVEVMAKDKYGRTVARIHVTTREGIDHYDDGTHAPVDVTRCLNEELLKAGLGWWYRQYSPKDKRLEQLEAEAKQGKRGLWADASPTPPWDWRRPDLLCRQESDCVFLPTICPGCPPCKPTPRRAGNREALKRIQNSQARVRCAVPTCAPCASERNWVGGKLACTDGRCAVVRAAATATASASAVYHGNSRSKVLHAPGCHDFDGENCTAGFKTVEDAKKAGYRPHAACVAPFEQCHAACLKRNTARAVAWELIEAECRRGCTK
jgi:endonuclease YncB( thermonuclease family)